MVYELGEVIGEGGMGEVVHAHDPRIGRDVAIKRLRGTPKSDEVERFMREARIQARLEHPAIVPVYEMGVDPEGRPYFAMKRLAGTSLREVMTNPTVPRPRLLRAFVDVCRAIDFAQSLGVVHRDLKPSNIVLGEFGEVYILDWGTATLVDEDPPPLVGTPGYTAPEALETALRATPAQDVYALGAILFEMLAGEPVHPRESQAALASTRRQVDVSPARRRPDRAIPPELDASCTAALARDPALRPTSRRLAEQVEAYLDGDRDVVRRKSLADDLVWSARAALDEGRRVEAMHAAGRALALDPEGKEAAQLVSTMILQPPPDATPELARAIDDADALGVRKHARAAIFAYAVLAGFFPLAVWNGVRNWPVVTGLFGLAALMGLMAWRIYVRPHRSLPEMMVYAACNAALLVMLSRLAGPFTFVPGLVCFMTMSTMSYPAFVRRPGLLIGTMIVGFATPIVLEKLAVLPSTWYLTDTGLCSRANALVMHGTPSITLVVSASIATIVMAGVHSATIAKASRAANVRLVSQAWHLSQLLPRISAKP